MARKNRVSVVGGLYHVTTRVANRDLLFKDPAVKDRIVRWMYEIADFSGIELCAWCVMDNHLHLFLYMPEVPVRYWRDPACRPDTSLYTQRPAAVTSPRYRSPEEGDSPLEGGNPPVSFMLDDVEMAARLRFLYGGKRAERIAERWAGLRAHGMDALVDAEKERYCRRMYNVSQYMKTLKEKISGYFNRERGHAGCVWQGRFNSGIVERTDRLIGFVLAYIACNPVKAKLVGDAKEWAWSSFALACGDGPYAARCRAGYESVSGQPWKAVRTKLEAAIAARTARADEDEGDCAAERMLWRRPQVMRSGVYVSLRPEFAEEVVALHPERFALGSRKSIEMLRQWRWEGWLAG